MDHLEARWRELPGQERLRGCRAAVRSKGVGPEPANFDAMAGMEDVPRDLEGSFLAKKEWLGRRRPRFEPLLRWLYPVEERSGWLPANAQELADSHPWTRRAVEKNPRFPGRPGLET